MAGTPKTRGTLIANEIDVLQARANDTSNPTAASDALYVSSALIADPRYLAMALDNIDSMTLLSAEERQNLRNSTLDTHQSSKDFIAGQPQNAALKQQAIAILDRVQREGVPDTPTVAASPDTLEPGASSSPDAPGSSAPLQTEYTVKEGDSLSKIARDHYGLTDPKEMYEKALELARQNGIDNPDLIKAGRKLILPDVTAPESSAALDQIMSRGFHQNSDGERCIVGTTAGGRSLDTVLSSQWTQAIGQNWGLTNFRTMEYRGPYTDPAAQTSSLLGGPYKLDSGNSGITGFTMAGRPLNTALGDAWALGVNGADFSRTPSLGAAPAADTSRPSAAPRSGW